MHVHLGAYVWVYTYVKVRGQLWASFIDSHPSVFWDNDAHCSAGHLVGSIRWSASWPSCLDGILRCIPLLFLFTCICMSVWVNVMCVRCHPVRDSLELELHVIVSQLNLGPLKEQQAPLTNKPYLQPRYLGTYMWALDIKIRPMFAWKHFTDWDTSPAICICTCLYI